MIKICHMTSVHQQKDIRIFYKECISLANAGYDTYLVSRGNSETVDGVKCVGVGEIPNSRMKRIILSAKRVYKAALELDADIYHLHDPELIPYGIKLMRKGKKVIFDGHEDVVAQVTEKAWIPPFMRPAVSAAYNQFQKRSLKKFDAVITVTPSILEQFKTYNPNAVLVTNYPIVEHDFVPGTNMFDSRKVVFAGNVSQMWRHETVVRAIADIEGAQYLLCGSTYGKGKADSYVDQLKALTGGSKLNFIGKIPHKNVQPLLSTCNAGMALLPYGAYSCGNLGTLGNTKIFEYMLAGIPIICTDFILWKQIVNKYNCGIAVDPEDVGAVTKAIKYIFDNPDIAKKMGENGRRAIDTEYNWNNESKKLIATYKTLEKEDR